MSFFEPGDKHAPRQTIVSDDEAPMSRGALSGGAGADAASASEAAPRDAPVSQAPPGAKLCNHIVLLVTEDWFALSHFRPLIETLVQVSQSLVVVTRSSGRLREIEALGARTIDFNFGRRSNSPAAVARQAWALRQILMRERADAVHMIAMKPIVLGGLAMKGTSGTRKVLHVTGQGLAGVSTNWTVRLYRALIMRVLAGLLRQSDSYLLVENPHDLDLLRTGAADPGDRVSILGGAGVDPDRFPALPPPNNPVPVAAHVGRIIHSKGIDVVMQAYDRIGTQGLKLQLELYGNSDADNPEAVPPDVVRGWCKASGAHWHGHVSDVVAIWRQADIFVLASRGGEGLPRALLEAAACARPLVVTDVPGNRDFVRNGVEGFLVPPADVEALASALAALARDGELRRRMGRAARQRLLEGYTEKHVKAVLLSAYHRVFAQPQPKS